MRLSLVALMLVLPGRAGSQPAPPTPRQPTVAVLSADASLVAAQTGATIHVWERATGKRLARRENRGFFRGAVTRGALIAVSDDGVTVWRGERFERAVRLETPKVLSMGRTAISADGRVASAIFAADGGAGDPDTVGVWDARSGRRLGRFTLDRGRVLGAALSYDGRLLAVFGDRREGGALLHLYRVRRRRALLRWTGEDRTTFCAAFSRRARRLALCAGTRLLIWDVARRRIVARSEVDAIKALFPRALRGPSVRIPGAHGVAFGPRGRELVTLHGFGVVGIARWSLRPLRPAAWIKRPLSGGTLRQVAWDPGGSLWLVTSSYAERVHVHTPRGDRFAPTRVLKP
jgi:WD40 repeat protein